MNTILIVDDEPQIREGLKKSFEYSGMSVVEAASGEEAIYEMKRHPEISYVITDYKMPGLDGFDVIQEVKKISPTTKVVMMTGHGGVNHAVSAIQRGADEYLCKPFDFEDLEKIVIQSPKKHELLSKDLDDTKEIITEDPQFLNLLEKAKRAAKSETPVLIEGPSGTGKELLARQIHRWSKRNSGPWVTVNCAALPSGLLESELFGYEKGAFTGANEKRIGKFEQADGGTLLLDEIGELDPLLQAKLLRVLQESEIDRLGSRKPVPISVRVIATTNRHLPKLVQEGRFREDLFFRLYGIRFELPRLADRPEDIEILAHHFLAQQQARQERELRFSEEVISGLQKRAWAGNIRELELAVERASILSETGHIVLEDFEFQKQAAVSSSPNAPLKPLGGSPQSIREMEREAILEALKAHGGNRTHTAQFLGMSLRTLRHKLKQYREEGIEVEPYRQSLPRKLLPGSSNNAPLNNDLTGQSWP